MSFATLYSFRRCPYALRARTALIATHCLLGTTFNLADAALLPFIRQFAAIDADWCAAAPYPALRMWLER
jgi:glutathione S-transferase